MNRLKLLMTQHTYGYALSKQDYADLTERDKVRSRAGKPTLTDLLYDTYDLDDINIYEEAYGFCFKVNSWSADEETLNLIANEIDQYIAGVENFWTGEDA